MSLSTVDGWDGDTLARSGREAGVRADELRALAGALAQHAAGLGWTGEAARAHLETADGLRSDLQAAARELELLAAVWRAAGEQVLLATALLARARALAGARGLHVGEDGRVRVPEGPVLVGEQDGLLAVAGAAEALAVQALAAAAEADRDAAVATAAVRRLPGGLVGLLVGGALLAAVSTRGLPAASLTPEQVAAWWDSLTPAEQRDLETAWPERVGRLDGVPVDVRDRANRVVLDRALRDFRFEDLDVLAVLLAVHEALERPGAQLLDLDPHAPGRAAVAFGDLETAAHVAVLVPGLNAHVGNALGGLVSGAAALRDRALSKGAGTVATVAWIGYDAPGLVAVTSDDRAQKGAGPLRSVLRGIDARAAAHGRDAHLTVSGHSYGSLVAGYALRQRTGADELVTLGSPGVGVGRADELWVRRDHVFVAEAKGDPVADLSRFGADPSSRSFGGRELQTDGGGGLRGIAWHTHYYDRGTESLDNLALVTVGQADRASYS